MLRLALLAALAALLSLGFAVASAAAQTTPLFPGATYERSVEFTPHGPVAIHVVRGPRPVGLRAARAPPSARHAVVFDLGALW